MPEIWFPNLGIEIAHLGRVAFTVKFISCKVGAPAP